MVHNKTKNDARQKVAFQTVSNTVESVRVAFKLQQDLAFVKGAYLGPEELAQHQPLPKMTSRLDDTCKKLRVDLSDASATEVVETAIATAIRREASDIHIEPHDGGLNIRYRQDGVLQTVFRLPKEKMAAVISRLKIMAELDIAEKRRPQDGRIRFTPKKNEHNKDLNVQLSTFNVQHSKNKTIDIRVSTLPTDFGEKVVLRILCLHHPGCVTLRAHLFSTGRAPLGNPGLAVDILL